MDAAAWRDRLRWWPFLIGPGAMAAVYVDQGVGDQVLFSRYSNEIAALALLAIPLVLFLCQAAVFRSEFHLFMGVLCGAFFCREWHFPGTDAGIYTSLALLGFWAFRRKERLEATVGNGSFRMWLWATFATYVLSQLIARRVFRYVALPWEEQIHVPLEETVESAGHVMMIVASLVAWKVRPRRTDRPAVSADPAER